MKNWPPDENNENNENNKDRKIDFSGSYTAKELKEMVENNPEIYFNQLQEDTEKVLNKNDDKFDLTEKEKKILEESEKNFSRFKAGKISEEEFWKNQNKLSQMAGLGSLKTKTKLSGNAVEAIISKQVNDFENKKIEQEIKLAEKAKNSWTKFSLLSDEEIVKSDFDLRADLKDLEISRDDARERRLKDKERQLNRQIKKYIFEASLDKKEKALDSEIFLREKLKGYQEQYYRALEKGNWKDAEQVAQFRKNLLAEYPFFRTPAFVEKQIEKEIEAIKNGKSLDEIDYTNFEIGLLDGKKTILEGDTARAVAEMNEELIKAKSELLNNKKNNSEKKSNDENKNIDEEVAEKKQENKEATSDEAGASSESQKEKKEENSQKQDGTEKKQNGTEKTTTEETTKAEKKEEEKKKEESGKSEVEKTETEKKEAPKVEASEEVSKKVEEGQETLLDNSTYFELYDEKIPKSSALKNLEEKIKRDENLILILNKAIIEEKESFEFEGKKYSRDEFFDLKDELRKEVVDFQLEWKKQKEVDYLRFKEDELEKIFWKMGPESKESFKFKTIKKEYDSTGLANLHKKMIQEKSFLVSDILSLRNRREEKKAEKNWSQRAWGKIKFGISSMSRKMSKFFSGSLKKVSTGLGKLATLVGVVGVSTLIYNGADQGIENKAETTSPKTELVNKKAWEIIDKENKGQEVKKVETEKAKYSFDLKNKVLNIKQKIFDHTAINHHPEADDYGKKIGVIDLNNEVKNIKSDVERKKAEMLEKLDQAEKVNQRIIELGEKAKKGPLTKAELEEFEKLSEQIKA